MREKSRKFFAEAERYMPGGVNSPVRAFRSVGGSPVFIERGDGSRIYDVDGNEYIDYICSWGPLILGHARPAVIKALKEACNNGTSFGAPTEAENKLAKLIVQAFPSIELVRMVNSGTEATMSAIRLARAYTGREKIIKFEGCYHGHGDSFLIKAGSGSVTFGLPDSPGVPCDLARLTITVPYNDLAAFGRIVEDNNDQIAAVIIEPVAGNMGVIPPAKGFLEGIRELTNKHNILLIFDEVLTGFRVAWGGAQILYDIKPDLTCLGKIMGGGLPVGAYGGKREIMELIAPSGPVYQAGTLSGNPLAMAAGYETLNILSHTNCYARLEQLSSMLVEGLEENAGELGVPVFCTRIGSMLSMFFTDKEVIDYQTAKLADTRKYSLYFKAMLAQRVYLPPSPFEAMFVSLAHTEEDIEKTIQANRYSLEVLKEA